MTDPDFAREDVKTWLLVLERVCAAARKSLVDHKQLDDTELTDASRFLNVAINGLREAEDNVAKIDSPGPSEALKTRTKSMTQTNPQTVSTLAQALRKAMESLGGVQRKPAIQQWIWPLYPDRWSPNALVGCLNGCCVNNPAGIRNHPSMPRFLYHRGRGEYELYEETKHGSFDEDGYPEGQAHESDSVVAEISHKVVNELAKQASAEFAYESHLRDYLAKNLTLLEPGLTLWTTSESDSVEYSLQGRWIDILAKDKDGLPVIIELKVSRGHERTIGQALYYRGKLKQLLGVAKARIIMVASEITDELRIASTEVPDVELFSYSIAMQVQKLDLKSSEN